jgi:hypothetical protein
MANLNRFQTAGDLINRVAISIGLNSVTDPFSSADPAFIQLCTLATECGQELVQNNAWQKLMAKKSFVTAVGDTGIYDLPDDFAYMIDQTGWQQGTPGAAYPLLGPASPQMWSYLVASQLYSVTIYAWFRVKEGKLNLWPQPPPVGIPIGYEYISRGWALDASSIPAAPVIVDNLTETGDTVLFEPILFIKKLKLAWLQAKGFDTTKAQDEFIASLDAWMAKDAPAPVLNLTGRNQFNYRFLNGQTNIPDTGYGS